MEANVIGERITNILNATPQSEDTACTNATLIVSTRCSLGESILYDDIQNEIVWTDMYKRTFYKLSLTTFQIQSFHLPKMLCSFALRRTGEPGYLCAWEDGFQLYDIENNAPLSPMSTGPDVNPTKSPSRLNDGRCDNDGRRYICGGFRGDPMKIDTYIDLYKCECSEDGTLSHEPLTSLDLPQGIQIANSICFSPDGDAMYLADSPLLLIYKYHYDKLTGTISQKSILLQNCISHPDGSVVDEQGYLWNAVWREDNGTGFVQRIHPQTGNVVFTVNMPDGTSRVTCCCFAGPNLDVLFVTTAVADTDPVREPHAGGVYAVKLPFRGRKEARFGHC